MLTADGRTRSASPRGPRGTWRLRLAATAGVLAVVAAHLSVTYAATGELDPIVGAVDGALAGLVLVAMLVHTGGLGRERGRAAVLEELVAALATPLSIEDAAAAALGVLTERRVAAAGLLAVARSTGDGDSGDGDAPHGELAPLATAGYAGDPLRELDPRPAFPEEPLVIEVQRETIEDPWLAPLEPALGRRPWVARVPIVRGDELLGVLLLTARRRRPLDDRPLLTAIGALLGATLDHSRLHQAAFQEREDLAEQESRRREFLYAIAHELRTPLTSIHTFAELLEADLGLAARETGTTALLLDSLSRGVSRLGGLVDDLVELGRVERTEPRMETVATDVVRGLHNAESVLRPAFMARQQSLTLELPEEPLVALVDARSIEQIAINLLSNANRFSPERGAITVRARSMDDRIRIEVEDSGPGIAADHRALIFEPFYRVPGRAGAAVPGAGLGLAIARQMLELQRGRIWVEDTDNGTGTRFCFELPRVAPPSPPPSSPPSASAGGAQPAAQ